MKFDLCVEYKSEEFYESFKEQHPNGTYGQFLYFWNVYKANRSKNRVKFDKQEGVG